MTAATKNSNLPPTEYLKAIGGHSLVAQILWLRGLRNISAARGFLDPDFYTPTPPRELPDLVELVARLNDVINNNERIHIWGDFDVDGQTSTSVLWLGLRTLGATVDFTIPNRATHSHGLNIAGIRAAYDAGARVLLTCDCGVTDFEEVAFARSLGMSVLISDHHDLGDMLPVAHAIVNPKRLPTHHALASLPGVGVAYLILKSLYEQRNQPAPIELLDLVALGIVADLAEQRGDTRYLLQRGLTQLRSSPRIGLRALAALAKVDLRRADVDDIGFQIAPRLNASGRLDDARVSVELLTTDDEAHANELARRIETLNQDRRALQRRIEAQALKQLADNPLIARNAVIVLHSAEWSASVLGIVASSVVSATGKPAVLISTQGDDLARASARSVEGFDIHAAIAAQHELIETSGGHPAAAGFSIRPDNIARFTAAINHWAQQHPIHKTDDTTQQPAVMVAWRDVSLDLCDALERLAPFGAGNSRPLLASRELSLTRVSPLGKDGQHLSLIFKDGAGHSNKVVYWRAAQQPPADEIYDITFTLQRNVYRDKVDVQIVLSDLSPSADHAIVGELASARFNILDERNTPDVEQTLAQLRAQYGADGVCVIPLATDVRVCVVLAITHAPASSEALRECIERAQPQTVVLLTRHDELTLGAEQESVLSAVSGMLKVAQRRGDDVADASVIHKMALRINHRDETVRAALDVLLNDSSRAVLQHWLEETRAYRRYFNSAPVDAVMRVESN